MKHHARRLLAWAATRQAPASLLSAVYRRLSPARQFQVHRRLAKAFVGASRPAGSAASWTLDAMGREVRLPVRRESLAVDWDNLLSVLGAEPEVKELYRRLLTAPPDETPAVFVDCGASYGTHSLLWAAHGRTVVAMEPNPECHPFFQALTGGLAARPRLIPVALGDRQGRAELRYPAEESWIGRLHPSGADHPEIPATWRSTQVAVATLDALQEEFPRGRMLLKLDVEGSELPALRGARRLLAARRPLVIIESWNGPGREPLLEVLKESGYCVTPLQNPFDQGALPVNLFAEPSGS